MSRHAKRLAQAQAAAAKATPGRRIDDPRAPISTSNFPPTARQRAKLAALGHRGAVPTRAVASQQIAELEAKERDMRRSLDPGA